MTTFHVHAFLWNEIELLPAFLKHYEQADKIFVYDNQSTDGGAQLVVDAGRDVITFSTDEKFDDAVHVQMRNDIWKKSRGEADYVIVQDLDEFVHFSRFPNDIKKGLTDLKEKGVTGVNCLGYTIVTEQEEWDDIRRNPHIQPTLQIKRGCRGDLATNSFMYDKPLLFDPVSIIESNIDPGGHSWNPTGKVTMVAEVDRPLMLHFKHLGIEREFTRRSILRERLRHQFYKDWSWQYNMDDNRIREKIQEWHSSPLLTNIVPIIFPNL